MIYFIADNHYQARPGAVLYQAIAGYYDIRFCEDDWSVLETPALADECDLLILNMIAADAY